MPEFTYDWFSPNIPFLTEMLQPIAHKSGKLALEIGCFEGRSTIWFMENVFDNDSSITCIDNFKGGKDQLSAGVQLEGVEERFRRNTARFGGFVRLLVLDSLDALQKVWHPSYDFIYIDGSHLAADVLQDAVLSWPLLSKGGTMIFDDYGWGKDRPETERPQLGIDSFVSAYRDRLEVIGKGYQLAIKKITP